MLHNLGLCQIGAARPSRDTFGEGISTVRLQDATRASSARDEPRSRLAAAQLRPHGDVVDDTGIDPDAEVQAAIAYVLPHVVRPARWSFVSAGRGFPLTRSAISLTAVLAARLQERHAWIAA